MWLCYVVLLITYICFTSYCLYLQIQQSHRADSLKMARAAQSVSSVPQSCPTLCDPMDCSTPGFPVHHQLPEPAQTQVHRSVMPSNHLIFCHPLLLLSSIFPCILVFSNKSVLHIRWRKYWSFSFSVSPSNEYFGLISFRMD